MFPISEDLLLLVCYAISAMSLRLPGEGSACQRHPSLLPPDQVVLLRAAEGEALSCLGPNLLPRPLSTFLLQAFWDLLVAARAGWGGLRRTRCKQAPGEFGSLHGLRSRLFFFLRLGPASGGEQLSCLRQVGAKRTRRRQADEDGTSRRAPLGAASDALKEPGVGGSDSDL